MNPKYLRSTSLHSIYNSPLQWCHGLTLPPSGIYGRHQISLPIWKKKRKAFYLFFLFVCFWSILMNNNLLELERYQCFLLPMLHVTFYDCVQIVASTAGLGSVSGVLRKSRSKRIFIHGNVARRSHAARVILPIQCMDSKTSQLRVTYDQTRYTL